MKLLLEAGLLLQGTGAEGEAQEMMQDLLGRIGGAAAREDGLALLRERGTLLVQAATLATTRPDKVTGKQTQDDGESDDYERCIATEDTWMDIILSVTSRIGKAETTSQ